MNILVTGANGQLGQSIKDEIAKQNAANNYLFTDIREESSCGGILPLDITDITSIREFIEQNKIEIIINCAAYTNVDKAEDEPDICFAINTIGVKNLATISKELNLLLVHISTDYIFDGTAETPYNEKQAPSPLGVYGKTKFLAEIAIIESGCRHLIFRTAWLYSIYGKNFVKTIKRLIKERENIKVVDDQIGTPTNSADLASAIVTIIERELYRESGVYNYTNMGYCSWFNFATKILELCRMQNPLEVNCTIEPCTSAEYNSKAKRPKYSILDKSKFINHFKIEIPHWSNSLIRDFNKI